MCVFACSYVFDNRSARSSSIFTAYITRLTMVTVLRERLLTWGNEEGARKPGVWIWMSAYEWFLFVLMWQQKRRGGNCHIMVVTCFLRSFLGSFPPLLLHQVLAHPDRSLHRHTHAHTHRHTHLPEAKESDPTRRQRADAVLIKN